MGGLLLSVTFYDCEVWFFCFFPQQFRDKGHLYLGTGYEKKAPKYPCSRKQCHICFELFATCMNWILLIPLKNHTAWNALCVKIDRYVFSQVVHICVHRFFFVEYHRLSGSCMINNWSSSCSTGDSSPPPPCWSWSSWIFFFVNFNNLNTFDYEMASNISLL